MTARTSVVTGGASGLGAEIARALRDRGDRVIVLDREPPGEDAIDRLVVDLGDEGSMAAVTQQLPPRIDVLCNVAGLHPRSAEGNQIVTVNFLGTRALTELLLPRLHGGGVVLNMASIAGEGWKARLDRHRELIATPSMQAGMAWLAAAPVAREEGYTYSKELLNAWTALSAAAWLPQGVRCVAVAPGPISTAAFTAFRTAIGNPPDPDIDLVGRPGTVQEVAPAVSFLTSTEAAWVNGTTVTIDGGLTAAFIAQGLARSAL